jgi:hypothetical protein
MRTAPVVARESGGQLMTVFSSGQYESAGHATKKNPLVISVGASVISVMDTESASSIKEDRPEISSL